jgi:WD40 repeat protein
VATLRLLEAGAVGGRHDGEIFSCAYAPDGAFVLSGGWDGYLRLWDAADGTHLSALQASPRPLSCCAFAPDGRHWLAGSMEGLLSIHDAVSHQTVWNFVAHTRPISGISFAPNGQALATASWDRQVVLRKLGREREGRTLSGHQDIVSGCRYALDSQHLLSWSHDGTLRLWDTEMVREVGVLRGHGDRVTAAALSPDGLWAASGGRDGTVRLWDLAAQTEAASAVLGSEVRACCFLLDGESVVSVDAAGRLLVLTLPGLEAQAQLETGLKVQCGDRSPSGLQLALGCEDGQVHFVAVEGLEEAPLVVTATTNVKPVTTILSRLTGKTKMARTYQFTCPVCRKPSECQALPSTPVSCPQCRRPLRVQVSERLLLGS